MGELQTYPNRLRTITSLGRTFEEGAGLPWREQEAHGVSHAVAALVREARETFFKDFSRTIRLMRKMSSEL